MGEVSEMMLDGTLCEQCGVFMGSWGNGIPRACTDCKPKKKKKKKKKKIN